MWLSDLRSTWRGLTAAASNTAIIVVVVAVGVGAASTIVAIADPAFARRLPFLDPSKLVLVDVVPGNDPPGFAPQFDDWFTQTTLFSDAVAIGGQKQYRVRLSGETRLLRAVEVSETFGQFLYGSTLRQPSDFRPAMRSSGAEVPVWLTSAWRRLFLSDDLPTTVQTWDGHILRIAGVLPDDFVFPSGRPGQQIDALVPF